MKDAVSQGQATSDVTGGADTGSEPVDLAHLARATMGEAALERDVLALFCSQAAEIVAQLTGASDARAWREAAHKLKGSAAAIGARHVAAAAALAEACEPSDPVRAQALTELQFRVEEARRFIDQHLGRG